MSSSGSMPLRHLPNGVTGPDAILGGGLLECSFNIIAGGAGAKELARRTKLRVAAIGAALERLGALGYTKKARQRGGTTYRRKQ